LIANQSVTYSLLVTIGEQVLLCSASHSDSVGLSACPTTWSNLLQIKTKMF